MSMLVLLTCLFLAVVRNRNALSMAHLAKNSPAMQEMQV